MINVKIFRKALFDSALSYVSLEPLVGMDLLSVIFLFSILVTPGLRNYFVFNQAVASLRPLMRTATSLLCKRM